MSTKSKPAKRYIVLWDDQQGLCVPMGPDPTCERAIQSMTDKVSLFECHGDARKAIDVSAKFAALQKAQGKVFNEDFLGGRKNLRIVPCG